MKRALVMVGVMVFSSPALADPNPTLGGTIAVITTAAAITKHASTSRNFTEGRARPSANGSAMESTKKRRSAKATANAIRGRLSSAASFIPVVPKTWTSGEVCCGKTIFHFIRRNNRKALDRSKALARRLCHRALAHNHDRSDAVHNLDRNAFARSRDPHHVTARRLVQKPRGTDR
jgi:hypothetical protein